MIGGNHSRWWDGRKNYEHKCRQCLHDARHAAHQTNNVSSAMKLPVISCECDENEMSRKLNAVSCQKHAFDRGISANTAVGPRTFLTCFGKRTHGHAPTPAEVHCRSSLPTVHGVINSDCTVFWTGKKLGQELKKTSGKQSSFNCLEIMHKLNQIEWTLGCTEGN